MSTLNAHDFTVGEILTAATMDGQTADLNTLNSDKLEIKVGTYTGDGSTSQAITGVGFAVTHVAIWENVTGHGSAMRVIETTSDYVDNSANGLAIKHDNSAASAAHQAIQHAIIALGADGFTVDDNGADDHPNKNGVTYHYRCIGSG